MSSDLLVSTLTWCEAGMDDRAALIARYFALLRAARDRRRVGIFALWTQHQ